MRFPEFAGNQEIKTLLSTMFAQGRLPHAMILQGEDGLGKHMLAEILAAAAVCSAGEENARRVNSIIHPCVFDDFLLWAERMRSEGCRLVGMESAILFESGFNKGVDKTVMVYAPEALRIRRVMQRDGMSERQVLSRMKAQMGDEEKRKKSDFVILNDGISSLEPQIDNLLIALIGRKDIG